MRRMLVNDGDAVMRFCHDIGFVELGAGRAQLVMTIDIVICMRCYHRRGWLGVTSQ